MTNPLTLKRRAARDLLIAAGVNAFSIVPETIPVPAAYIAPGDPYVTRDETAFGRDTVRLRIGVLVEAGTNEVQADDLDDRVLQVCAVFEPGGGVDTGFTLGDVSQPGPIALNGQSYLAAVVEVLTEITRSAS